MTPEMAKWQKLVRNNEELKAVAGELAESTEAIGTAFLAETEANEELLNGSPCSIFVSALSLLDGNHPGLIERHLAALKAYRQVTEAIRQKAMVPDA